MVMMMINLSHVSDPMLSPLGTLLDLILSTILCDAYYYYLHFTEGKTVAEKGHTSSPWSHAGKVERQPWAGAATPLQLGLGDRLRHSGLPAFPASFQLCSHSS